MADKKTIKPLYIIVAIALVIGVLAVAYLAISASAAPVVAAGDNVSVYYTGKLSNGTEFGSNFGGQPLQFTVGANEVIPGFQQAVIGMKLNETKNITIAENEAYGPINPQLIIKVPTNSFGNQTVTVGMIVTENTNSGEPVQGDVTAVNATTATVNFNSPLAGQTLIFTIKVIAIEKAK